MAITLTACTQTELPADPADYPAAIGLTREEALTELGLTENDVSDERSPYTLRVTAAKMEIGGMPFEVWLNFEAASDVLYSVVYEAESEGQNAAYFDAVKAYTVELTEAYGEPVTSDGRTFYLSDFDSYAEAPKAGAACRDVWNVPLEGALAERMPLTFTYKGETTEFSKLYAIVTAAFDERGSRETSECRIEYRVVQEDVLY